LPLYPESIRDSILNIGKRNRSDAISHHYGFGDAYGNRPLFFVYDLVEFTKKSSVNLKGNIQPE